MPLPIEKNSDLDASLSEARKDLQYQIEYAKESFSDELWQAMEQRELNQVQFAEKAGVPKQFLTKIFRGSNCTIETMAKLAHALNYRLSIHIAPQEYECSWMHFLPEEPVQAPSPYATRWMDPNYDIVNLAPSKHEKLSAAA